MRKKERERDDVTMIMTTTADSWRLRVTPGDSREMPGDSEQLWTTLGDSRRFWVTPGDPGQRWAIPDNAG